jgi:cytochrome c peroxidase
VPGFRLLLIGLLAATGLAQGRRGPPRPRGELLLVAFDANRNGAISAGELATALRHLDADGNGTVEPRELAGPAARAFGELDTDGDGALDRAELKRAAQRMPRLPQPAAKLPAPDGPLPPLAIPRANPLTPAKAVLGKILFWEQQVSSSRTVACGTCHAPNRGGADARLGRHPGPDGATGTADDIFGSPGIAPRDRRNRLLDEAVQVTPRSSPAFFGTLHAPRLFWDGRAGGAFRDPVGGAVLIASGGALENQALAPILNRVEMSRKGRTWHQVTSDLAEAIPMALSRRVPRDVLEAIATAPTYPKLFERAFGDARITPKRIAFALASYERTLVPDRTPFDRWIAGDKSAMTSHQVRGWRAFRQSACAVCHAPPFFTDHTFRNIGVRPPAEDAGRAEVTQRKDDRGKFKVPSLRNVGLRRRFMHNGRFTSLQEVLNHYDRRGTRARENLDPLVERGINFGPDRRALLDFLTNALTDPRAARETGPFDHPSLGD